MVRKNAFAFTLVIVLVVSGLSLSPSVGYVSAGSSGLADSPWPMFHGNVGHTGLSPYDTSTNAGMLKWKFQTGGMVDSSPAVGSDGTIYFGSFGIGGQHLYALNSDGSLRWKFDTGAGIWSSPAVGSDGTIYFGSDDHYFYALNPDGGLKWKFRTGSMVVSSPAIGSDGTIYFGSDDGYLYAIGGSGEMRVPSEPRNLVAEAGDGYVRLTWEPPSDDGGSVITNYKIYRGTSSGEERYLATVGDVLTYTDTGLTNGQTYYYRVSAVNGIGEGNLSDEISITPSNQTDGVGNSRTFLTGMGWSFALASLIIAILAAALVLVMNRRKQSKFTSFEDRREVVQPPTVPTPQKTGEGNEQPPSKTENQ